MKFDENNFNSETDAVKKYEKYLETGNSIYLSEEEMDEVINYYTYNDKYKQALIAVENSISLYPYESIYYVKKSEILNELGKMNEALKAIDKAMALEPANHENYISKGEIYEKFEEYNKAIDVYKEAIKMRFNPTIFIVKIAVNYHFADKLDLAKNWMRKLDPKLVDEEITLIEIVFGFSLLQLQNQCIDFLISYTDENPYSERAWLLLSQIYFEIGELKKALWAIDFSIAIKDYVSEFWSIKGIIHFKKEEYNTAIESFIKAIELDSEESQTFSELGQCYLKLNDWQTARKHFKTALKLERDNASAWAGIGSSFILQNKNTDAVHYLKRALKLEPCNESFQLELAKAYFNLEKYQQADNIYFNIVVFNPDNTEAWLDWSYLHWEMGNYHEAFEKLYLASPSLPPQAEVLYRLASYSFLRKKIKEGTKFLEEALGLNFNKKDLFFKFAPKFINSKAVRELIDMYNPENYYK
ncbi:MAG: tetratricopeptide repeat protein [Bacteroidetes bacterium]|nr:tetratricopeptide repeat protein [Bacteroidota bacterium]